MNNNNTENKVTWKGWASLIALIVILSGMFNSSEGALAALDYNNLVGSFGTIVDGVNFTGQGGVGVKAGFMIGLTLIPGVMFCRGLVAVVQELGGLQAAGVLFRPILKPLLGIPGTAGLAFVSSFTGSDIAALLTKDLHDEGYITDDERTVFISYQYAASAIIDNTINAGAPLIAISPLAVGPIILIELISKIFGANIVRLVIKISNARAKKEVK